MASTLREHFEQRAADLADCADLERHEDSVAVSLLIAPRAPNALGVYLTDFGGYYVIPSPARGRPVLRTTDARRYRASGSSPRK